MSHLAGGQDGLGADWIKSSHSSPTLETYQGVLRLHLEHYITPHPQLQLPLSLHIGWSACPEHQFFPPIYGEISKCLPKTGFVSSLITIVWDMSAILFWVGVWPVLYEKLYWWIIVWSKMLIHWEKYQLVCSRLEKISREQCQDVWCGHEKNGITFLYQEENMNIVISRCLFCWLIFDKLIDAFNMGASRTGNMRRGWGKECTNHQYYLLQTEAVTSRHPKQLQTGSMWMLG